MNRWCKSSQHGLTLGMCNQDFSRKLSNNGAVIVPLAGSVSPSGQSMLQPVLRLQD